MKGDFYMGVMNEDRLTLYDGLIKTHITNTTVAKETGKGLSTNDYTTDEKTKLAGIATGANKTTVDSAMSSTSTNPVQNKIVNSALSAKAPLASPTLTGTPKAPTAAKGTNTTQIATTAYVQKEVADLKKSVSDGKTLVATAITDKGVDTAADATFAVMAANVRAIESGGGIGLNIFTQEIEPETKDGIWIQTKNQYESIEITSDEYNIPKILGTWDDTIRVPYDARKGFCAVSLNDEIHVLGSGKDGTGTCHYKYNGSDWSEVSTLPYDFRYGSAVVFNNEIHILGSSVSGCGYNHYKFNGTEWVSVSTLPYIFKNGCAVVFNGEIHIIGSNQSDWTKTCHYKFNGTGWDSVSTLSFKLTFRNCAVVFSNKIHIVIGSATMNSGSHYAFDGKTCSLISSVPFCCCGTTLAVFDDALNVMGGDYGTNGSLDGRKRHYKFNGTEWVSSSTLPFMCYMGVSVVLDDTLYLINGSYTEPHMATLSNIPYISDTTVGAVILIYENETTSESKYYTKIITNEIFAFKNNKFPSGFDDIFYIDESNNVETAPTYYGNGTQWIKFKN